MKLEYLEDPSAQPARVLLLFEATVAEVEAVRAGIAALAIEDPAGEFRLNNQLRGFSGVDGCSLVACVGKSDLGVEQVGGEPLSFRCVLSPSGWRRVFELLEPFLVPDQGDRFQYLTEVGAIDWIISTSRGW